MCLLAIAFKANDRYPLIVAANRDEFLDRPALPLHFWPDAPHILAGRDLRARGTWMGVTTLGRFAAITNHRDLRRAAKQGPSRGLLVRQVLEDDLPAQTGGYEGFNLIYGNWDELWYHNNIDGQNIPLPIGVHGLSNAFLNTPWPKVRRAKEAMERIAAMDKPNSEDLFDLLADETPALKSELPDTGVGVEWETVLSPVRIRTEGYGTRCSTVLVIDRKGKVWIEERSFGSSIPVKKTYEFRIERD